jgi:hypothetical protein
VKHHRKRTLPNTCGAVHSGSHDSGFRQLNRVSANYAAEPAHSTRQHYSCTELNQLSPRRDKASAPAKFGESIAEYFHDYWLNVSCTSNIADQYFPVRNIWLFAGFQAMPFITGSH